MGCDIHIFVEQERLELDVPDSSHLERGQTLRDLDHLATLLDSQDLHRAKELTSDLLSRTSWKLIPVTHDLDVLPIDDFPSVQSIASHPIYSVERNYLFFAALSGVRTSFPEPICPPRGFPEDASRELQSAWGEVPGDPYHGATWLLVEEILGFDWDRPSPEDLRHWGQTYRQGCTNVLSHLIPWLQSLGDPSTTRMVVWFDG